MRDRRRSGYDLPQLGSNGQTNYRQLDGLAELGGVLSGALKRPVEALWQMRNGYALCTRAGLDVIGEHLRTLRPEQLDVLRGKLCIGVHSDVEVTDAEGENRPLVSQERRCISITLASRPPSVDHQDRALMI